VTTALDVHCDRYYVRKPGCCGKCSELGAQGIERTLQVGGPGHRLQHPFRMVPEHRCHREALGSKGYSSSNPKVGLKCERPDQVMPTWGECKEKRAAIPVPREVTS
jgi:hypothetical protein